MNESTNREKVLKKVRSALLSKTANPFPNLDFDSSVFHVNDLPDEVNFAEKFIDHGGNFILCEHTVELIEMLLALCEQNQWRNIYCADNNIASLLSEFEFPFKTVLNDDIKAEAVLISCAALLNRTGEIVFTSTEFVHNKSILQAQNLVVICSQSQLRNDMKHAITCIRENNQGKMPTVVSCINPQSFVGGMFVLLNLEENKLPVFK